MAMTRQMACSNMHGYFNQVYNSGDEFFNHPDHHGTPNERLSAAYLGAQMAVYSLQNNKGFTYQEFHDVVQKEIKNFKRYRLKNQTEKPLLDYPKNLTKEYIQNLYPS